MQIPTFQRRIGQDRRMQELFVSGDKMDVNTKPDDHIGGGNTPCMDVDQAEDESSESETAETKRGRVGKLTEHAVVGLRNKILATSGEEGALIRLALAGVACGARFEVCPVGGGGVGCHCGIKYLARKEKVISRGVCKDVDERRTYIIEEGGRWRQYISAKAAYHPSHYILVQRSSPPSFSPQLFLATSGLSFSGHPPQVCGDRLTKVWSNQSAQL
jgi:hypothetical protein